jgi:uncharacterized phage protein gp47/JayE
MPQVQLKRHEQILQDIIGRVVARSSLSDVSDTAQFKWLAAGIARELDETYFQFTRLRDLFDLQKAAGEDLDERAQEIQPGTVLRVQARRAIGTVVFSRTLTVGTVTIPAGTVVKTADGTIFTTTLQAQILNTQTSSTPVSVVASEPGVSGNVPAATVVKFGAKIPGVDVVTNTTPTTQGRDKESDDSFRQRLLNFIASLSRCTPEALEFLAVGAEDPVSGQVVQFAKIVEDIVNRGDFTLYIDDGAGTAAQLGTPVVGEVVIASALGGEEYLNLLQYPIDDTGVSTLTITSSIRGALVRGTDYYLNPANGQLLFSPPLAATEQITASYTPWIGLIAWVQQLVDGVPSDRLNYPGYRAAGTRCIVASPTIVAISVEAALTVSSGADLTTAIASAEAAVLDYINNVGISGDIIRNELIERIMGVSGVTDVDLIIPSGNVVVLDDQLPRTNTGIINIT